MNKEQLYPLVSVCIAVYNAEKTIKETILSVIGQSYSNIEIIVNDNCSTDATMMIVKDIKDSRIQVFSNSTNLGMSKNFDIAVSKASGDYVKLLCADDLITDDCIEKQVKMMLEYVSSNVVAVTASKKVINAKGKSLFVRKGLKEGFYDGQEAIKKGLRKGTNVFGEPGCILYKKEALLQSGEITVSNALTYVFDLNLICRVLKKGNLYVMKEPLFMFRVTENSYTAKALWEPPKVFGKLLDMYVKTDFVQFSTIEVLLLKVKAWVLAFVRNIIVKIVNLK